MRNWQLSLLVTALWSGAALSQTNTPAAATPAAIKLPELHGPARVLRDTDGMRHIYAFDEHDTLFLQGWFHAEDRLFQIDFLRRTANGTLAELVGSSALPSDVQLRTIGLRRSAERSLPALSAQTREGLQAYVAGVNAWIASHPLPNEYRLLGLTKIEPWTALDTVAISKLIAFQLSFDDDITPTLQFLEYQEKLGTVDPRLGSAVFFLDTFRSAPFSKAATVPDSQRVANSAEAEQTDTLPGFSTTSLARPQAFEPEFVALLKRYKIKFDEVPLLKNTGSRREREIGSNEWAVAGTHTQDGRPLIANDPHLSLGLPATLYDVHIVAAQGGLDAIGSSFAGVPWVVLGQNRSITWGETVTGFDVTDYYQEQIVADPSSPSGLATVYQGTREPIVALPVTFKVNLLDGVPDHVVAVPAGEGIPPAVLIVPRRNSGPLLEVNLQAGSGVSLQYTGFSATRELDSIRLFNHAQNQSEFVDALQFLDFGSENFIYADVKGNIGYFTTGEVPLREDLQAGTVQGSPPWFIRDGRGGNEWLRLTKRGATDGTGYQYVPARELPQVVNPRAGFIVNANNDPSGLTLDNDPLNQLRAGNNGILYLAYTFDIGLRAGRITELVKQRVAAGSVSRDDIKAMQADVVLSDAKVLAPYITKAFDRARAKGAPSKLAALAADVRVTEAVGRLVKWNFTAPTGVPSGYDADIHGEGKAPAVSNSIAATIYSVWRSQLIALGLDRTLSGFGLSTPPSDASVKAIANLLARNGIGESTVDYFSWAGLEVASDRRDYVVLRSLRDALASLASPAFGPAFNGSTAQADYQWGKLHRVSFEAVLGGPFNIPGATPGFPPTFPQLEGLAVDGGFGTVDVGAHDVRANSANEFMFTAGPNRRYVGSAGSAPGTISGETILPGGMSGVLGDRFYANLLERYLRNQTYPLRQNQSQVLKALDSEQLFETARRAAGR